MSTLDQNNFDTYNTSIKTPLIGNVANNVNFFSI